MQEGGVMKFKATDEPSDTLPVVIRSKGPEENYAHSDIVRTVGGNDMTVGGTVDEWWHGVRCPSHRAPVTNLTLAVARHANP